MIKESNKILDLTRFTDYSKIFVETGSCMGRSIQFAIDAGYRKIKSVEAKLEYYLYCKKLFEDRQLIADIDLYWGKSVDKLPEMLSDIESPAVFWLDAHVSGEASAGYQDWLEKLEESDYDQHKILTGELSIILNHRKDHIILIDDQNGWNDKTQVYLDMILKISPAYKFYFYDEQMGDNFYKNKSLVAIP